MLKLGCNQSSDDLTVLKTVYQFINPNYSPPFPPLVKNHNIKNYVLSLMHHKGTKTRRNK